MSYHVGIDLGTTYSAAAVCRPGGGPAEVVPLGQRATSVPSTVYVGSDGVFQVGEAAERHALSDPGRVVREFKRRIGDPTPVHLGREPVAAEVLSARFVSRLLQDVAAREGAVATRVALTHPAGWGSHKLDSLRAALAAHGLRSALLLSEPQAAAIGYASTARVRPGAVVAVYDLGGGTFDAAVVRKSAGGGFELLGTPEGLEHLGGLDFDEVVFGHVRGALGAAWESLDPEDPEVLAAVAGLRRECTAAKEALSHDTEVMVSVLLPGVCTQVRLGRGEFEEMISPAVRETLDSMRLALDSAGVAAADLDALLLVGGSSRIPLITQLVSEEFGRSAAVDVDPKGVIAVGAALVARAGAVGGIADGGAAAGATDGVAGTGSAPANGPDPGAGRARAAAAAPKVQASPLDRPTLRAAGAGPIGPAVRPPKQARPFAAVAEPSPTGRRRAVGLAAGVLALVLLGGAVAFGATRVGANREADASIPTPVVNTVAPSATSDGPGEPPLTSTTSAKPAPAPPPAGRGPRRAPAAPPPAPSSVAPTTGSAAAPPPSPPATTVAPPAPVDPPQDPAVDENNGNGNGNGPDNGSPEPAPPATDAGKGGSPDGNDPDENKGSNDSGGNDLSSNGSGDGSGGSGKQAAVPAGSRNASGAADGGEVRDAAQVVPAAEPAGAGGQG